MWPPKTTTNGPAAVSQEKDISLDTKRQEGYKSGYYNKDYTRQLDNYKKDYQKPYGNGYNNNYNRYGGYRRPYNNYSGGYNRGYNNYRGYNGGYSRGYRGNYNRGYSYNRGYGRGGYNSGYYRNNTYNYNTQTGEVKEPKDYRCPSCKNLHKISSFCPNTGSMVVNENQLSLNYEGSRQTLPTRTLQRYE
jgi:hypothetical protein